MDINDFRGIMTLITMLLFIGICIGVYSKKRKKTYDEAARMVLDEEQSIESAKHVESKG
ncbi:MAG: cbb3-type cytochrome c oxidase subunit 3 [Kangiellaceae bacterium]|nr:cbb3-type cytochrome c oxidase subunit 3 [Kangiellaceae bacterium]